MAFISDGARTWDPERKFELKCTSGGPEFSDFELVSLEGSATFYGAHKVKKLSSSNNSTKINPNSNTVIYWSINIMRPFSHISVEDTKEIIRQSMDSFEWSHGMDRKNGNPLLGAVCDFYGKYA